MRWAESGIYHLIFDTGFKVTEFRIADDWKYIASNSKGEFLQGVFDTSVG